MVWQHVPTETVDKWERDDATYVAHLFEQPGSYIRSRGWFVYVKQPGELRWTTFGFYRHIPTRRGTMLKWGPRQYQTARGAMAATDKYFAVL